MILVTLFYVGCVSVATYPAVRSIGTGLPHLVDPLVHLWTMRWYKTCLTEGRLPFLCPEIQYPVGAPLGYLPPMHFQSLIYLPLSLLTDNDVLCYNLIWFSSFLLTGLGTFCLAWYLLRDRWCACVAGMLAMLSGPMLSWSHEQLEQITVGWFPLFLVGWLRLVDRPTWGRVGVAVALYALLSMSAPYFAILGVFPALLYVLMQMVRAGRSGARTWLKARIGWFAAFSGLTLPILMLLFSSQIWAIGHGYSMTRSTEEFNTYAASFWGYIFPESPHLLCQVLPRFEQTDGIVLRVHSYLGVVTLFLLAYAAFHRVAFPKGRYLWVTFAFLLVLSLGAFWQVGPYQIGLPAHWLREYCPAFRPLRVPGRFNLFAAVCASVIAAAGLRHLLSKMVHVRSRVWASLVLTLVALVDLSTVPFGVAKSLPEPPSCYRAILERDPDATFLEAPQFNAGYHLPAACTYWQSIHRGRTSAGYTAYFNPRHEGLLSANSPFHALRLADPNYLANPNAEAFDLIKNVSFLDYTWLYLTANGFDYVILHQKPGSYPELPIHLERLKAALAPAKVMEDEETVVYDRLRLQPPRHPVVLSTEGWRHRFAWRNRYTSTLLKTARLVVYNPTPERPLRLRLEASAYKHPRTVRLLEGGAEVASWTIRPEDPQTFLSPPLSLPQGLQELTLSSDGDDKLPSKAPPPFEGDLTRISLLATGLSLEPTEDRPPQLATQPDDHHDATR